MSHNFLNIFLAFFEGFALIISPCILPILPIFLASSLTGSRQRPFGLISGFMVIFAVLVFFSRMLIQYLTIDLNLIRYTAYGLLLIFGIILTSGYLSHHFSRLTQGIANKSHPLFLRQQNQQGFLSGFILGGLLAVVWVPCAGPILASVIVQTVLQKTNLLSFFTLLAFALGAGMPLLILALYGRKMMNKLGFFKRHAEAIRKLLGFIIILSVGLMVYQEKVSSYPASKDLVKTTTALQKGLWRPYTAPEIQGIETWLNSKPLTIRGLKGKVVLIDFWTYSCINCLRTLPYLKDWYQKYHNKGLVIIGVHSPEFYFEKSTANVKRIVQQQGIVYPVALDNQFTTWNNFNNKYWPAHYLIDKTGRVVYQHFGEGAYDITENNIRFLTGLSGTSSSDATDSAFSSAITPETYLGYERANKALGPSLHPDKENVYQFPQRLVLHAWALQGKWKAYQDKIVSAGKNAAMKIHFNARHVYMVMGSVNNRPITVKLLLNGEQFIDDKGKDVNNSRLIVTNHKLYTIVDASTVRAGILQIIASNPGLEIYTFTFGN